MLLGAAPGCADVGWLAGFSAPLGNERGEGFVGELLKGLATGKDGVAPFGIDPKLHCDSASHAFFLTMPTHALPCLFGGREI